MRVLLWLSSRGSTSPDAFTRRSTVFLDRRLGAAGREELAMGAIATGRMVLLNDAVISLAHVSQEQIDGVTTQEKIAVMGVRRQGAASVTAVPLASTDTCR